MKLRSRQKKEPECPFKGYLLPTAMFIIQKAREIKNFKERLKYLLPLVNSHAKAPAGEYKEFCSYILQTTLTEFSKDLKIEMKKVK